MCVIAHDVHVVGIKTTDVDYRLISFREDLFEVDLNGFTEVSTDLDDTVKIIQIRNVERNIVALVVFVVLDIAPAAVRITETGEIDNLNTAIQSCSINTFLRHCAHRLINMRCKYGNLFHDYPLNKVLIVHPKLQFRL